LKKTGAYKKLKKTLAKTPRKETNKKESVKEEPIVIEDESMVISDGEEIVEIESSSQEANDKSGDEFDTTAEMEQEEEEDGEVQE